ncbi:MAG: pyridoxal phosphate-dependent aminotransferase, partial [Bacteroidales bacterium]|nr:pyridoxal phosphate-dependent aminotransferase [Bacteroidales bacterium]
ECGIRIGALITKNKQVRKDVMKFCQARLCPPLIGQIVAEASMDVSDEYMQSVYDEYLERRNYMIKAINEIPGCYSPMPMGAFSTVARLPIDDADKFCAWLLESFEYQGKTLMIAPASGFYSANSMGRNEVRMAYVMNLEDLSVAMDLLRRALEIYPGRTM